MPPKALVKVTLPVSHLPLLTGKDVGLAKFTLSVGNVCVRTLVTHSIPCFETSSKDLEAIKVRLIDVFPNRLGCFLFVS